MAKSGKKVINTDDGRDTASVLEGFFTSEETKEAVETVIATPTSKNIEAAKNQVLVDSLLTDEDKQLLLDEIEQVVLDIDKSFKIIPSSYDDLKKEVVYLSELYSKAIDLSHKTFVKICERLYTIRDQKLYEIDGFNDFKSFVENTLPFSRSTTYEYLDIYEYYNVSDRSDTELIAIANNRSKLRPYIQLLKSDKLEDEKKEEIKQSTIEKLDSKSKKDFIQEANDLKVEYGLVKPKLAKPVKTSLVSALSDMHEGIKLLSHPKANDAYQLVIEMLEMKGLITGKELGDLNNAFIKCEVKHGD